MKTKRYGIQGFAAGLAALLIAGTVVADVDQATAAGDLAEVSALAVEAKANLAAAALGGDVDAITEAGKRSDAVDAAVASAQEAYSAMERAIAGGDQDAASTASDDLKAAVQAARDAFNGVVPESIAKSAHDQWKESQTNTGGGPGRAGDAPNIYDVPWQSQGLRSFYQGLFGSFWSSSAFGGSRGFGERDATPE